MPRVGNRLVHYYRPFSRPFLRISALGESDVETVLAGLADREPLPYRLMQASYLPERRRIEALMRAQFCAKGGAPELQHPHYFVLGEFSLWEGDGSRKVELALASIPERLLSFTLTDSFFNYRRTSLRGVEIPARPYHGDLYTLEELPVQLEAYGLPSDEWASDAERRFEVYVEAQVWSDEPLEAAVFALEGAAAARP